MVIKMGISVSKGKLSVLKGLISEYIACYVLGVMYRDEIAKIVWHPKLDYYPKISYHYNMSGGCRDYVILSVYIRDRVDGMPLPYIGMCSSPRILNVFECIPQRVTVLDFNGILSIIRHSTLRYKEFRETLVRLTRYMRLTIFGDPARSLRMMTILGRTMGSNMMDLLDLLGEIWSDRNILLRIFEFLASKIDVDKLVEGVVSTMSLNPSYRDYIHGLMN